MFTRFGGVPDARVKKQLTRGARIRAILAQQQLAPLSLAEEIALVEAVQDGILDPLPLPRIGAFRAGLSAMLARDAGEALRQIGGSGTLNESGRAQLRAAVQAFATGFQP